MLIDLAAMPREAPEPGQENGLATKMPSRAPARAGLRRHPARPVSLRPRRLCRHDELPTEGGALGRRPVRPETLRHYGIRTGTWTGIGAGAGAAVDVGTGGLTLGAGTLTGALIGTGAGLLRSAGQA
jgi:hypothetical protein